MRSANNPSPNHVPIPERPFMRDRRQYQQAYYRKHRAARLAYQRRYDAAHKEEKAKRMRTYKHLQRHGERRSYVLMKDCQYKITAFLKRWEEKLKNDPKLAAWDKNATQKPRSLEAFTAMLAAPGD